MSSVSRLHTLVHDVTSSHSLHFLVGELVEERDAAQMNVNVIQPGTYQVSPELGSDHCHHNGKPNLRTHNSAGGVRGF